MQVIADVEGQVFAYRDEALLVVVRGEGVSMFAPVFEPVRDALSARCWTLGFLGPHAGMKATPEWARGAELSVYKVWPECPPYEHVCAEVGRVAS